MKHDIPNGKRNIISLIDQSHLSLEFILVELYLSMPTCSNDSCLREMLDQVGHQELLPI